LKSMFTAPLSYTYPNTQLPSINDGWYVSYFPSVLYEAGYYRYRLPKLAWAMKETYKYEPRGGVPFDWMNKEPWSVVLGPALPARPDASSAVKSTDFDNLGICVLRTGRGVPIEDEIMFTFDYGRFLGHGQLDKMGITLFANNRVLAADYGTPGYGSKIMPYYKGGTSHNLVIVDGKKQGKSRRGKLSSFFDSALFKVARSDTNEVYPGVEWTRTVILTDGYGLVIDDLSSNEDHQYDWFFHSEGDEFAVDGYTFSPELGGEFKYSYISDVKGYKVKDENWGQANWQFADGNGLSLTLANEPDTKVFTARCPAETGVRTIPLLVARQQGRQCQFLALLFPYKKQQINEKPRIIACSPDKITVEYRQNQDVIRLGDIISFVRRNSQGGIVDKVTVPPRKTK